MKIQSLIFVYNANSGAVNSFLNTAHKIVSPETYVCNLCALTFGNFKENTTWKNFREQPDFEMLFLHKDEFLKQYRSKCLPKYDFPVILVNVDNQVEVFMDATALNEIETTENLIVAVVNKIKKIYF